jgi:subfamily B ATP-binding cassette protein MsbA
LGAGVDRFFVFPASVLPIIRLSRNIKKFTSAAKRHRRLTVLLQESIQGNRIVKAFGMESYEDGRFMAENGRLFKQSLRASRIKAMVAPSMELLASFGIAGWFGTAVGASFAVAAPKVNFSLLWRRCS